jgi:hypothetical protein
MDLALLNTLSENYVVAGLNKRDWLSMVYELPVEDVKNMVSAIKVLYFILLILLITRTIY